MFTENFLNTLKKEGVATFVSWTDAEPHLAATWNSYITVKDGKKLLVPIHGMQTTQKIIEVNNRIKMVIGSKEVAGMFGPGAGFLLEGTARFLHEGQDLDTLKKHFPWAVSLMEISVNKVTQTV